MITLVTTDRKKNWQSWDAERLIKALKQLYSAEAVSCFQPAATCWAEVAARASSIEAFRLSDPLGPINNKRGKILTKSSSIIPEVYDAKYGLAPRSTASSNKDSSKSKQGSKAATGKDNKSTACSGCGGISHTVEKCLFKEHPDFKYPDDESKHRLNRKTRIDGTPLKNPIELRQERHLTMTHLSHTW
jgi:hypothetical protein